MVEEYVKSVCLLPAMIGIFIKSERKRDDL